MTEGAPARHHQGGISAVVLTWRDVDRTLACVESLLASPHVRCVLVVDNETAGQLRNPLVHLRDGRIRLVEEPKNLGFSAGINRGLRLASSEPNEFILVINNDATIETGSLDLLLASLIRGPGWLAAPRICSPEGVQEESWGKLTRTMGLSRGIPPKKADYFTWACVLFPKELLSIAGYLDENFFMYYEDVEYCRRMQHLGLGFVYVNDALVTHATSSSHGIAGPRVQSYSAHGLMVLSRKERKLIAGLVRNALRSLKNALRGHFRAAFAVLGGAWLGASRPNASGHSVFFGDAVE